MQAAKGAGFMASIKDVAQWLGPKWRSITCTCVIVLLVLVYYVLTAPTNSKRPARKPSPHRTNPYSSSSAGTDSTHVANPHVSYHQSSGPTDTTNWKPLNFDPYGNDTMVFVHIQKTGGTQFSKHLITLERRGHALCNPQSVSPNYNTKTVLPKKELSYCPRDRRKQSVDPWLICGKTVGWMCGVHAFFTEFKSCLGPQSTKASVRGIDTTKNFHYVALLRHPVLRYVSEYLHVQRGARWSNRHKCRDKEVTDSEMPPCYPGYYDGRPWVNVSLSDFYSCQSNWANNRQTMMIADLEEVDCFSRTLYPPGVRASMILESAKSNLAKRFTYFALTEYMNESILLFERTFGLKFGKTLEQRPLSDLHSAPFLQSLWDRQNVFDKIATANSLDMELYKYALDLFSVRAKAFGIDIDYDKVNKEIQALDPSRIAHTARKFTKLKYDLPQ